MLTATQAPLGATYKQAELKKALALLAVASSKRTTIEVLRHVSLRGDGPGVTLATTNLSAYLTVRVPALAYAPGSAYTLDLALLRGLIDGAAGAEIKLGRRFDSASGGAYEGRVSVGAAEFAVPAMDDAEFPAATLPLGPLYKVAALPTALLLQAVTRAIPFVMQDESRPQLGSMEITLENNGLGLRSVDGIQACTQRFVLGEPALSKVVALVPLDCLTVLVKALAYKGAGPITEIRYKPPVVPAKGEEYRAARIDFVAGDVALSCCVTDGQMPTYDHLLATPPDITITANVKELTAGVKMLRAMKPYGDIIKISVEGATVSIGAKEPYTDKETWLPLAGATYSGVSAPIQSNGHYLLINAAAPGTPTVTISTAKPQEVPNTNYRGEPIDGTHIVMQPVTVRPVPDLGEVVTFYMPMTGAK